ncbi:hypothetical protein [Kordiimonas gwangyangensis]|uniref:hypothetical protein n=1 Tax=Kordiimonas gwangyangensis TaxID=288022 RepID=UPI000B2ABBA5|nr:hypothetical protein [Kordiimonas gwangyangensis]
MKKSNLLKSLCLGATMLVAPASTADDMVKAYVDANAHRIMADFRDFLSMPNVASDTEDMMKNARWITGYIGKRGFESEIVSAGGAPYVIAERKTEGATKTVLIYAHFDGQPVAPENWATPPFRPTCGTAWSNPAARLLRGPRLANPSIRNGACSPDPPVTIKRQ